MKRSAPTPNDWIFEITHEARTDGMIQVRTGWMKCYHDFDRDSEWFAIWFLAPLVILYFWWQSRRWVIERWLRWRIADVPATIHCGNWILMLRPISRWTLERSRPHSLSSEYKEIEMRWHAAILAYDKRELDKKRALLMHLFGPRTRD